MTDYKDIEVKVVGYGFLCMLHECSYSQTFEEDSAIVFKGHPYKIKSITYSGKEKVTYDVEKVILE